MMSSTKEVDGQAIANKAIRLASNAWRRRQVAAERAAASDVDGASKATDIAVLAEGTVARLADMILEQTQRKGKK